MRGSPVERGMDDQQAPTRKLGMKGNGSDGGRLDEDALFSGRVGTSPVAGSRRIIRKNRVGKGQRTTFSAD